MKKIEVKNLNFAYNDKKNVIDDMSFSIEKGKYVTILGHNGSGKSTLSKLLMGLLSPDSGQILIDGKELTETNAYEMRKKMALVFQNPDNQFVGVTVEDDVAFGLENRNVPHAEMQSIIDKYVSLVGMSDFKNSEPSQLSGGQKQRVAIASVLSLNPEILILDEATSMLDPKGKTDINELIKNLKKDNPELTVICITHDVNEALLGDEVLIISSGKAILSGNPEEIFTNKEAIESNNLELPFIYEIRDGLLKVGFDVPHAKNIDEIVEGICKSK